MAVNQYINKIIINGETKIDLTADTVTPQQMLKGIKAHDKSGAPIVGTCTFDADTTDATATAAEILQSKTAYVGGQKVEGLMKNNGSVKGELLTLAPYTVPQGYHDGAGTVGIAEAEKAKLIPENIRQGVTVLGIEGTMSGTEGAKAEAKTVTPSFVQQEILPNSELGYNYLSSVTVKPIPVSETDNPQGGKTLTVG